MNFNIRNPLPGISTLDRYIPEILHPIFPRPAKINILFVCEGLAFNSSNGFSFKLIIDTLRNETDVKYANFDVTLASWASNPASTIQKDNTPATYQATFSNYRFSSFDPDKGTLILDDYDEVWLFGITPNANFAQSKASILGSNVCPTNDDLIALTRWMNRGGGVLAMGDHASLGANLCARIPRVWTMRRWTEEDGAPPRIGEDRVDTNQPMWDSQNPNINTPPETIPFEAQSDDIPQKIQPRKYKVGSYIFGGWRPHPVLCGGKLGVLDVLPDHPHEGWIKETTDINLNADILLDSPPADINTEEYPTISGNQPKPEVIAWGNTLPSPPYDFEKGETDAKHFGVIGAYDGQKISLGRVVVDSTWHHWMSINLSGDYEPFFDGDPDVAGNQDLVGLKEANDTNYKKVIAYYKNVAVWLAPPTKQQSMLTYTAFWSVLSTHAMQDWRLDTPVFLLGKEGLNVLGRSTSDCFVRRWIRDFLPEILDKFDIFEGKIPSPRDPFGPLCLTCPPIEHLETIAMGTLLHNMMQLRNQLLDNTLSNKKLCEDDIQKELFKITEKTKSEVNELISKRIETELKLFTKKETKKRRTRKTSKA